MKKRKTKAKKKPDVVDRLYRAAADYVEDRGGTALIAHSVQIQKWPRSNKFEYVIGVRLTGKMPEL